jgi:hypothetical protein
LRYLKLLSLTIGLIVGAASAGNAQPCIQGGDLSGCFSQNFTFTFNSNGFFAYQRWLFDPSLDASTGFYGDAVVGQVGLFGSAPTANLQFSMPNGVTSGDVAATSDGGPCDNITVLCTYGLRFSQVLPLGGSVMDFFVGDDTNGLGNTGYFPPDFPGPGVTFLSYTNGEYLFTFFAGAGDPWDTNFYNALNIPEPTAFAIFAGAVTGLGWLRRRQAR